MGMSMNWLKVSRMRYWEYMIEAEGDFKVGDRVLNLHSPVCKEYGDKVHDRVEFGTVIDIEPFGLLNVQWDDVVGVHETNKDEVRLVKKVVDTSDQGSKPKFKVGDEIVCRNPEVVCDTYADKVAEVVRYEGYDGYNKDHSYEVVYDDLCYQTTYEKADGMDLASNIDQVNNPIHYNNGGKIECIEYIKDFLTDEEYRGYLRGNIGKYLHRWPHKGKPIEDLEKARWYLNRLIEHEKKEPK